MTSVGIYGLGHIGRLVAKVAIERGYEISGAVDIDPKLIGKDVGEVLGLGERLGVHVTSDPSELAYSDVVIHSTGSYLDKVYDQLVKLIDLEVNVLSTCETLSFPYYRYPTLAKSLEERAIRRDVAVLGSGINPGFLLDALLIVLSAPFDGVRRIHAVRSLDAAKRREPFRRKIGLGLDVEEARRKIESGELSGHVGYAESALLVASAFGASVDSVEEAQEVVVAEQDRESEGIRVERGRVLGMRGYGSVSSGNRELVRVEFIASLGAEEFEEIVIEGSSYSVKWRSTGTPGDMGTASVIVNLAERIGDYGPGLLTMVDLLPFRPRFV
ncbi:MAG: dihydrodipicolinate reductase [Acidilobaceae archaeon]